MDLSFGLQLEPQFGYTKQNVDEIGRYIEKSIFDIVWVSDHMFLDKDAVEKSAFDALTVMTYLVSKFELLKVGSLVFCNSYRHPSIMAKKIVSLDNLAEGRLEVGYGAGWKEIEYNAYGIPFPSVKTRLEQLEEGLQVLLKLWGENEKASYQGKHYTLQEALCYPKPFQKPHPNLWIGTMTGGNKMLRIAAQYGDGINIAWAFSAEKCSEIFTRMDKFSEEFNREPLKRSVGFWVRVYPDEEEMAKGLNEEAEKRKITLEAYKDRIKGALIGTPEMVKEKLQKYKDINVSHFIFMFPHQQEIEYMDLFEKKILSTLK
ncbi:MAG: LLM class flavin-dependent oxidoreductase [Candidatus Hodarchaeales archaeon]|jgi:alkanesulfonate monooxygenase SsuD/methylene tetrahydromethanopterin reductase-like flavin-dependent oxidoreductase (luciferase family)